MTFVFEVLLFIFSTDKFGFTSSYCLLHTLLVVLLVLLPSNSSSYYLLTSAFVLVSTFTGINHSEPVSVQFSTQLFGCRVVMFALVFVAAELRFPC